MKFKHVSTKSIISPYTVVHSNKIRVVKIITWNQFFVFSFNVADNKRRCSFTVNVFICYISMAEIRTRKGGIEHFTVIPLVSE